MHSINLALILTTFLARVTMRKRGKKSFLNGIILSLTGLRRCPDPQCTLAKHFLITSTVSKDKVLNKVESFKCQAIEQEMLLS